MIAIESMAPGADMDREVETAIMRAPPDYPLPCYSSDWNAAFAAAVEFGLFGKHGNSLAQIHNGWIVYDNSTHHRYQTPDPMYASCVASAPTGPLAICRAILKLTEGTL